MTARTVLLASVNQTLVLYGTPPVVTLGAAYSFTFQALFGSGVYTFGESGSLPSGLTFTDNGDGTATIAGTTSVPGSFPITVSVQDTDRNRISKTFTLVVQSLPLTISGTAPSGTQGVSYSYTFSATGGVSPYTWSTSGSVPPGLSINSSTGVLSGTPTAGGSYSFSVLVTDTQPDTASSPQSVSIAFPTLTLTGTYADYSVGSYSSDLAIAGGNGVYSNPRVTTGSLPTGTSLSIVGSNLRLSGTIPGGTTASFTATVAVDSGDGQTATHSQTINLAFDPSQAFASGEQGIWLDPSDFSTMFQDSAGTIPVTATGQSVALLKDKSGRGNDVHNINASSHYPVLQQDGNGNYYLQFTSSNSQWLERDWAPSTLNLFNGTGQKTFIFAIGYKFDSTGDTQWVLTRTINAGQDGRYYWGRDSSNNLALGFGTSGGNSGASTSSFTSTAIHVFSGQIDQSSGSSEVLRVDAAASSTGSFGTLDTIDEHYRLILGAYENSTVTNNSQPLAGTFANGRFYGLVMRFTDTVDTTLRNKLETWMDGKCNAY